jgi:hypothetical protein
MGDAVATSSLPGKSAKRVFAPGDPANHPFEKAFVKMDARIKSGHDMLDAPHAS